jgi:hypothetical protein
MRVLIALALVACISPLATAQPAAMVLEAKAVRAEGISLLSGALLAFVQEPGSSLVPAGFRLDAAEVLVETTVREPSVHLPGVSAGVDPDISRASYSEASIQGRDARAGSRLNLYALPGSPPPTLQAETGCTQWERPREDKVQGEPRIPTRTPRNASVDVRGGARLTECGTHANWIVEGDFFVMLWERDATLQAHGGKQDLQSGRFSRGAQATKDPIGFMGRDVEVHLLVKGGRLTIPMEDSAVAHVGPSSRLDGAAGLTSERASLRFADGGVPIQAERLELEGQLDLLVLPGGALLHLRLVGQVEAGEADGQVIATSKAPDAASPPLPASNLAVQATGFSFGALVGLVALAYRWRLM